MKRFNRQITGMIAGVAMTAMALAPIASAQDESDDVERVRLGLRGWYANVDGDTSRIRNFRGGRIELGDKLDLSKDVSPELFLRWQVSDRNALEFSFMQLDTDGDTRVRQGVVIDGTALPLIADVKSELELYTLRAAWLFRWFGGTDKPVLFETSLGLLGFDFDASYEASLPGFGWVGDLRDRRRRFREFFGDILPDRIDFLNISVYEEDQVDLTAGTPTVGIHFAVAPIDCWSFDLNASGIYLGDLGHFVDASLSTRLTWKFLYVEGGYRYWTVDFEVDDDEYDLTFDGFFAGVGLSF